MRILVPVDFSNSSNIALEYAVTLAKQCNAEVIVVHVLPDLGPSLGRQSTTVIMNEMLENADIELKRLAQRHTDDNIFMQVVHGSTVYAAISPMIETDAIDIIVMGTQGASGMKKIIFGSNTVDVVNHISIPIVAVPEHTVMQPVNHLLYASDFTNIRNEVKYLIPVAKMINAALRIINMPPDIYMEYLNTERLVSDLKKECHFENIEISLLKGDNVMDTLENYAASSQGELLTLFTHKSSFLEHIFKKSITRELVWHGKIPMLIINREV